MAPEPDCGLELVQVTDWGQAYDPGTAAAWDACVQACSGGVPTLLSGWRAVLTGVYRLHCHFLLARQAGQVVGVLPLFAVDSPLTGRSLQSLPGGYCAASPQAAQALLEAADALGREHRAAYLLLRDCRQLPPGNDLDVLQAHAGVRCRLGPDPQSVWQTLDRGLRRTVRQAQACDGQALRSDPDQLEPFYITFARFNHQAGTPGFGRAFLQQVTAAMPAAWQVSVVYHRDQPAAGFFCLILGRVVFGLWGAALPEFRSRGVTHQAYWSAIQGGCQGGFTHFDLGRAPYPSPQFDFKARWGEEIYPIYQIYQVYRGKAPFVLQVSRTELDSPGLALFRRTWRRLPFSLAQALGPQLRRHIPFG